jgi:hypothetical protein
LDTDYVDYDVAHKFLTLFHGLEHTHAIQHEDGSYSPVHRPIREDDLYFHFAGHKTLGMYLIDVFDRVYVMVIDIDIDHNIPDTPSVLKACQEDTYKQYEYLKSFGVDSEVEDSGSRGYHVWMFLEEPIPAWAAVEFGDIVTLSPNPLLVSEEMRDKKQRHEFFPKQTTLKGTLEKLGNLIKLPMGWHQKQRKIHRDTGGGRTGFCWFVNPKTFKILAPQSDVLDHIKKIPKSVIEQVIGKEIHDENIDQNDEDVRHRTINSLAEMRHRNAIQYDIYPISDSDPVGLMRINTMHKLVSSEDVNVTPPCIRESYHRAVDKRGVFWERVYILQYLAHVGIGFTPDDIAGFFRYRINNAEDNSEKNRSRLFYYIPYFYGPRNDPSPMASCKILKEYGLCANFGFKPASPWKIKIVKEMEKQVQEAKEQIEFIEKEINNFGENANADISVTDLSKDIEKISDIIPEIIKESKVDFDDLYAKKQNNQQELQQGIEVAKKALAKKEKEESQSYEMICTRFISPLSDNGWGKKKIFVETVNNQKETGKKKTLVEIPIDQNEIDNYTSEQVNLPVPEIEEELCISVMQGESTKLLQYDDFSVISMGIAQMIEESRHKEISRVDEGNKTTRVGITTSTILEFARQNMRCLLCVPFTSIGINTFGQAVQLSEQECLSKKDCGISRPIHGGVLGPNIKMCLKKYKLVKELEEQWEHVALWDFPFIKKATCVSSKGEVCEHWKDIKLGYMRDENGCVSPLIESICANYEEVQWCKYGKHITTSDSQCLWTEQRKIKGKQVFETCEQCPDFLPAYKNKTTGSREVCAYATLYRHLIQDDYGADPKEKIFLSKEEILELLTLGYGIIPKGWNSINDPSIKRDDIIWEEWQDINGLIQVEIMLKPYDSLVMTYQKLKALFKVQEVEQQGSSENKSDFLRQLSILSDAFVFDEISRFVGQSPSNTNVYLSVYAANTKGLTTGEIIEKYNLVKNAKQEIELISSDNCPVKSEKARNLFLSLYNAYVKTMDKIQDWLGSRLSESQNAELFNNIQIPEDVRNFITHLQEEHVLDGIESERIFAQGEYTEQQTNTRTKIRYINGIEIRENMVQLANELSDLYSQRIGNYKVNNPAISKYLTKKIDGKTEEYKQLLDKIKIKEPRMLGNRLIEPGEIAVTNLYVGKIDDGIYEKGERGENVYITFDGYKQGTFVGFQCMRIDNPIMEYFQEEQRLKNEFKEKKKNYDEDKTESELVVMYNFLEQYTIKTNTILNSLMNLLMLSFEKSFFADSTISMGMYKSITLQMEPIFIQIAQYAKHFAESDPHKIVFCTDATMPFISLAKVFDLPVKKWKFGDPRNSCEKQLVVPYNTTYSAGDVYGKEEKTFTWKEDLSDYDLHDLVPIELWSKKGRSSKTRKERCVLLHKPVSEQKYRMRNVESQIKLFQLSWFLNAVNEITRKWAEDIGIEERGMEEVFVIFPNKELRDLFAKKFRDNGGMDIDYALTLYLRKYHSKLWENCIERGWLVQNARKYEEDINEFVWMLKVPRNRLQSEPITKDSIDMHHFRGDRTIGTASAHRIMVTVCDPASPIGSMDWLAYYYHSQHYFNPKTDPIFGLSINTLSAALQLIEEKSSFFQAISRVKDPAAKIPSVVFTWGLEPGFFEWAECFSCKKNEKEIYNSRESVFDMQVGIYTDEICQYEDEFNNTMVLCYDCVKQMENYTLAGYAPKTKKQLSKNSHGVDDLLAFRVPVPQHYETFIKTKFNDKSKMFPDNVEYGDDNNFLFAEREMLEIGRQWLYSEPIPNKELMKMKRYLTIQESINHKPTSLMLSEFKIREGDTVVPAKHLEQVIKQCGYDNFKELGMEKFVWQKTYKYRLAHT